MKLLYSVLFAIGFINQILITNALPTTSVTPGDVKRQCPNRSLRVQMEGLQFVTGMLLSSMKNKTVFCPAASSFQQYLTEFGKTAKQCLEKSEAYVANFGYQAVSNSLIFLCKSDGQNIDIFQGDQSKQCGAILDKSVPKLNLRTCIDGLNDVFFPKTIAKDICQTLRKTEHCSNEILSEHCSEFTSLMSLHRDFFKLISKPCSQQPSNSTHINEV